LTGVRAGRVFNREMFLVAGADAHGRARKATNGGGRQREPVAVRAAVADPAQVRMHHARKPGGVVLASAVGAEAARGSPRA